MKFTLILSLALAVALSPAVCLAYPDITLTNISVQTETQNKYLVHGRVKNETDETREVILRGQVAFYDKAAPAGDVPLSVIRKDLTLVLKGKEERDLQIVLLIEGTPPTGSIRLVPNLRVRRQREWNY